MKRAHELSVVIAATAALFLVPAAPRAEGEAGSERAAGVGKVIEVDEDGLTDSGKVIEVGEDGSSRVVKGEGAEGEPQAGKKAPKDAPTLAESCRARFAAQCTVLKKCLGGGLELPCDQAGALCDQLQGKAPYSRNQMQACAKGIARLRCDTPVDPSNPASLDFEARVPACKKVMAAERAQGGGAAPKGLDANGKQDLGQFDLSKGLFE